MVKIYADGADLVAIERLDKDPRIAGFTTNPTLMRKAGVIDYKQFCRVALAATNKPISFEVFSDEFDDMERQARVLAALGANVYVKIPITNTRAQSSGPLIARLNADGIKVNVTAVFHPKQIMLAANVLSDGPAIISIFAGRIADAGLNPQPICELARRVASTKVEILWASTRELINIKQAEGCGCDIITVPNDLLKKLDIVGRDLIAYSLQTVREFHTDAKAAGYVL